MNPGDPSTMPVRVTTVASRACAIPKSITFGSSGVRITLADLRSRWITPAAESVSASITRTVQTPFTLVNTETRAQVHNTRAEPCRQPITADPDRVPFPEWHPCHADPLLQRAIVTRLREDGKIPERTDS
jgi:hypothetical protein